MMNSEPLQWVFDLLKEEILASFEPATPVSGISLYNFLERLVTNKIKIYLPNDENVEMNAARHRSGIVHLLNSIWNDSSEPAQQIRQSLYQRLLCHINDPTPGHSFRSLILSCFWSFRDRLACAIPLLGEDHRMESSYNDTVGDVHLSIRQQMLGQKES